MEETLYRTYDSLPPGDCRHGQYQHVLTRLTESLLPDAVLRRGPCRFVRQEILAYNRGLTSFIAAVHDPSWSGEVSISSTMELSCH